MPSPTATHFRRAELHDAHLFHLKSRNLESRKQKSKLKPENPRNPRSKFDKEPKNPGISPGFLMETRGIWGLPELAPPIAPPMMEWMELSCPKTQLKGIFGVLITNDALFWEHSFGARSKVGPGFSSAGEALHAGCAADGPGTGRTQSPG